MIDPTARLSIRRIPLACLQIKGEYEEPLSPERLLFYYRKLLARPGAYAGLLYVVPSDTHAGMSVILDGRHRFLAALLAGRHDALCVVEEGAIPDGNPREGQALPTTVRTDLPTHPQQGEGGPFLS